MSIAVGKPRTSPAPGPPAPAALVDGAFARDMLAGLAAERKHVPPKYFYDRRGSELFERITTLPEYYPARTEIAILEAHASEMAKLIPADAAVVEFGAGSAEKTRILLRAAPQISAYVPVDISGDFLAGTVARLGAEAPQLRVMPVEGDFTRAPPLRPAGRARQQAPGRLLSRLDNRKFRAARGQYAVAPCRRDARPRRAVHRRGRSRQGSRRTKRRL